MFHCSLRVLSAVHSRITRTVISKSHLLGLVSQSVCDMADQGESNDPETNNRKRNAVEPREDGNRSNKDNGSRRRRGWNEPKSTDSKDVAPGSYAHESLRALLNIQVPELIADKADGDDSKLPSKKKVAMLVGYCGGRYGGFQMNADQRTVQAEIELALLKAKLLSYSNFGYPFKYNWSTSGRTDKGVHACAQVCAAKLHIGDVTVGNNEEAALDQVRERINKELPHDVRILHVARTTRGFCAKNMRAHVRYQYMIPSFCLHPSLKQLFIDNGITWQPMSASNGVDEGDKADDTSDAGAGGDSNDYNPRRRLANDPLTADELATMQKALCKYRASPEQLERLQQGLVALQGTHSFHHFTKNVTASDAKATRYILSYISLPPVVLDDGVEWIPTQVTGQSFLVYQVRKMSSLLIDVARGAAQLTVIERALAKDSNIRLNVAPAQGLFKEMSYYNSYNQRKNSANPELQDLEWDKDGSSVRKRWLEYKVRVVHHIVRDEALHANFVKYMFNQDFIFNKQRHYKLSPQTNLIGPDGES
ncbi:hypothetical protein MPSEU_000528300 [Mayamaea pseudoterrestris]|nr:hypothetical protein MPSEU_000528300 [Mayamaea pseudoterrestris]